MTRKVAVVMSADDEDAVNLIHEAVLFLKSNLERQQCGMTLEQTQMLARMEEITQALKDRHAHTFTHGHRPRGRTVPVLRV